MNVNNREFVICVLIERGSIFDHGATTILGIILRTANEEDSNIRVIRSLKNIIEDTQYVFNNYRNKPLDGDGVIDKLKDNLNTVTKYIKAEIKALEKGKNTWKYDIDKLNETIAYYEKEVNNFILVAEAEKEHDVIIKEEYNYKRYVLQA